MKLKVDEKLCELHGQCVFVAPELFRIDDDHLIYVADVEPGLKIKVERAVKACPQQAIKLEE